MKNKLAKTPDVILTSGAALNSLFDTNLALGVGMYQIANYERGGFLVDTAGVRTKKYASADVVFSHNTAWIRYNSDNNENLYYMAYRNFIAIDLVIPFLIERKDEFQTYLNKKYVELADKDLFGLTSNDVSDYLDIQNYFTLSKCGVPLRDIMINNVLGFINLVLKNQNA
jgi:hypothetical protein